MHDYIINASTIRECNFAMGTILGKGFPQAQVYTEFMAQVPKTFLNWSNLSKYDFPQDYQSHGN